MFSLHYGCEEEAGHLVTMPLLVSRFLNLLPSTLLPFLTTDPQILKPIFVDKEN